MNKHLLLIFLSLSFILSSCNSFYETGVDCRPKYNVKVKYDNNIKFADAFSNEVNSVTLFLFDSIGRLAKEQTYYKSTLDSNLNTIPLPYLEQGIYSAVIWGNYFGNSSFVISPNKQGDISINDLKCYIKRNTITKNAPTSFINKDLTPIFHSYIENIQINNDTTGIHYITANLTKNTKIFRITIQHLSQSPINISDFNFSIEADNGYMSYNNSLLPDEIISYQPWHISNGSSEIEGQNAQNINLTTAEITTGRLVEKRHTKLIITNKEGLQVLSLPLVDYILLTKGNYRKAMSNQEYLDRQDEYNITLFLDKNNNWLNTRIIINGWVITNSTSALGK